jgi:MoxR-like ATPase
MKLVFTTGSHAGRDYVREQGRFLVGRGSDADCVLDDGLASNHHAEIVGHNGNWRLADLDSSNGTEVNGATVMTHTLRDGDVVTIGETTFTVLLSEDAEAPLPRHDPPTPESPRPAPVAKAEDVALVEKMRDRADKIRTEAAKVIVGQREVLDQVLMCILANGHALLIGLPGMAKTLLVRTLARVLNLQFKRVQFTPDLMPTDIIGTDVLETNKDTGEKEFRFIKGPIFCNLLLADEINRTPPKTQAALLEAMQEKCVTAGNTTYDLVEPFFVLATQNPIEQEGTYPLPEAQLDRFMFNIWVDYPKQDEEEQIVGATTSGVQAKPDAVMTREEILQLQDVVRKVPVSEHVIKYAISLVRATRPGNDNSPEITKTYVSTGAGPRAGQYLVLAAKAMAVLDGRIHVGCSDIRRAAAPVLRHRILTTFAADSEGLSSIDIVNKLVELVPEPGPEAYGS